MSKERKRNSLLPPSQPPTLLLMQNKASQTRINLFPFSGCSLLLSRLWMWPLQILLDVVSYKKLQPSFVKPRKKLYIVPWRKSILVCFSDFSQCWSRSSLVCSVSFKRLTALIGIILLRSLRNFWANLSFPHP